MAEKQLGTAPSDDKHIATKKYVTDTVSANVSPVSGFQSVTTAAGTTTLTSSSVMMTRFTGSTTQTCVLPDATTLTVGRQFVLSNRSTGSVQVNANGGGAVQTLFSTSEATLTLTANGTAAGTWDIVYLTTGGSVGTPATAFVSTSEATASTSYTDLTTTTDSVTITVGASGMVQVFISSLVSNSLANGLPYMGFTLSGANTLAANDNMAIMSQSYTAGAAAVIGSAFLLTGLNAGSTTFKAKYKSLAAGGGTSTFVNRRISVVPINNANLWAGQTNNLSGAYSSMPAAGVAGRTYTSTDIDSTYLDNGSSWDLVRIGGGAVLSAPPTSGWSTNTLGTSTVAADRGGRLFTIPPSGNWRIEYRTLSPTSNYTFTICLEMIIPAAQYCLAGIVLYDSVSGKIVYHGPSYSSSSSVYGIGAAKYTNSTTFSAYYSANYAAWELQGGTSVSWYRFIDDGTNRLFQISMNGIDWIQMGSVSRTDFLTPTHIGWGAINDSGITQKMRLRSWTLT